MMPDTSMPAFWIERMAVSRPEPGPLTWTSTRRTPCSMAPRAAFSAAIWAAKGVDLREPLKPTLPADAQDRTLPAGSVIVAAGRYEYVVHHDGQACPTTLVFSCRDVCGDRCRATSGEVWCHASFWQLAEYSGDASDAHRAMAGVVEGTAEGDFRAAGVQTRDFGDKVDGD